MTLEQEKKWREEFEELKTIQWDFLSLYEKEEMIYLAARKAAQIEIDEKIRLGSEIQRLSLEIEEGFEKQLKDRNQEIERLKKYVNKYGNDRNHELREEIMIRDELIKEAYEFVLSLFNRAITFNGYTKQKEMGEWLEKSRKLVGEG